MHADTLVDELRQAVLDPGSVVDRGSAAITRWQQRGIVEVLRRHGVEVPPVSEIDPPARRR